MSRLSPVWMAVLLLLTVGLNWRSGSARWRRRSEGVKIMKATTTHSDDGVGLVSCRKEDI